MTRGWALQAPQLELVFSQAAVAASPATGRSEARPLLTPPPLRFEALLTTMWLARGVETLQLPTFPTSQPGTDFMLAARLASTQSLNTPKHRRDGKSPVTPPLFCKPAQAKAKRKAPIAVVKKTAPTRHVWLSARPEKKEAEIIRLQPRGQRAGLKRVA